jgi:peptide/nickel transport system permease protein
VTDNAQAIDDTLDTSSVETEADRHFMASQWQLVWRKFRAHRLAMFGLTVLLSFYVLGLFSEFFSVNDARENNAAYVLVPPQGIHFFEEDGTFHLRPFVYGLTLETDPVTWKKTYVADTSVIRPLALFPKGHEWSFFGLTTDRHFVGVSEGKWLPFGTDDFGRCMFSRTLVAAKISLFIGIAGVMLSFVIGSILGGISGYMGGKVDILIQRIIEIVLSIPTIPLWMALAAALPSHWSSAQVFFGITIVLSLVGWANLARVVRGKTMELREADFVLAAHLMGVSTFQIITRHILPSISSYLIVSISLGIPGMIIAETALSFLQIGIKAPAISWGVLLQSAQSIKALTESPWLLIPGIFVVVTVLCYNFVGDGLRDAADPYK